jgi:hypothetical protein
MSVGSRASKQQISENSIKWNPQKLRIKISKIFKKKTLFRSAFIEKKQQTVANN